MCDQKPVDPKFFIDDIVQPDVSDFTGDVSCRRKAFHAVTSVDALAAHIFYWLRYKNPSAVASYKDDTAYREHLAKKDQNYKWVRDTAKALKHYNLTRGKPIVRSSEAFRVEVSEWDHGHWDCAKWDSEPRTVATSTRSAEPYVVVDIIDVVQQAFSTLKRELVSVTP